LRNYFYDFPAGWIVLSECNPASRHSYRLSTEEMNMAESQLVSDTTVARVTKSIVDIGIPGFSCYMDNDIRAGAVHTLAGLGAAMVFGPIGMWLVAANSISRSSSGRNLWELAPSRTEAVAGAPPEAPAAGRTRPSPGEARPT
jgi:hypothetical protein